MVIVVDGKNDVRDYIYTYIDQGGLGTDTTSSPSESDDGLNATSGSLGTSGTIKSTTNTAADKSVKFEYTLPSTDGNGNTFTEFGLSNSTTGKLFNRQTFIGVSKTSAVEFSILVVCAIE